MIVDSKDKLLLKNAPFLRFASNEKELQEELDRGQISGKHQYSAQRSENGL